MPLERQLRGCDVGVYFTPTPGRITPQGKIGNYTITDLCRRLENAQCAVSGGSINLSIILEIINIFHLFPGPWAPLVFLNVSSLPLFQRVWNTVGHWIHDNRSPFDQCSKVSRGLREANYGWGDNTNCCWVVCLSLRCCSEKPL